MKTLILNTLASILLFTACNNDSTEGENKNTTIAVKQGKDEMNGTKESSIDHIVNSYLQLKNALAKDNDNDAAAAGNAMVKAFESFDSTSLTAEQVNEYNEMADEAREHAEHIGANAGNIKHQREHFETLSQELYELVKAYDFEQKLYVDYCPMYNDNKGAIWLSESKAIYNPYMGQSMLDCGTVKEELN